MIGKLIDFLEICRKEEGTGTHDNRSGRECF